MKPPKRLFRDRRPKQPVHDMRVTEHVGPATMELPDLSSVIDVARHIIWVPVQSHVELDTTQVLRGLEDLGFRVDYLKGASAIDVVRSMAASSALIEGFESMLFVDSDMSFSPEDALRLLLHPDPVVAGCYSAKKLGDGQLNCVFEPDQGKIRFGPWAQDRLYRARCFGAGMMRIKCSALTRIKDGLGLPYCRIAQTYGWPFFLPVIAEEDGEPRYLSEDYAFCWRCRQVGIQPMADTSIRVYHIGSYKYGIEEATGHYIQRQRNLELDFQPAEANDPMASVVALA